MRLLQNISAGNYIKFYISGSRTNNNITTAVSQEILKVTSDNTILQKSSVTANFKLEKFDNAKPIYLFNLNKKYDMDGDVSWNTARLINHSCSNNCDYNGTGLKLWVVAIKDIKKGEEITADYGFGYDEDYKQFACKCKSKNCCGYIVRAESRWRINKKFSIGQQKASK